MVAKQDHVNDILENSYHLAKIHMVAKPQTDFIT